jgi:PPOX class probable F420-dependent enzyme
MDDAKLRGLVAASRTGVLATVDPDGTPQMSNIYFIADADGRLIRFSTTTTRRKGRNLQRHPRAAVHVAGENFLNFAVAEGAVRLTIARRPDDDAVAELREVHSALGASFDPDRFGEEMVADHRMVVRLDIDRIYGQLIVRDPRIKG